MKLLLLLEMKKVRRLHSVLQLLLLLLVYK
jgi:hypothetical protein